ncbi:MULTISPECIES: aldehyde dehydrogenase family protein [unclassified Sphingobium]|uniref:aldehyde dehydrogenase family protein n=1 Tax=unclassified Sphingobium TaxID=2611147 RepID=UPI000D16BC86|nr:MULTISPECIES: aldehyde dehydrogenase family protein [unclassified Sphingobium]MBG6120438.1 acyl-CoA reductase-like NAD-dependent aldehyde dehydrogenase [Sphingobium sp. JAI105]PSO10033.1 aldehyde dehydrogenase [Sphingobium sp. AEW4]TWC98930.1 acyl-CoA reductase-like NAD-dependent aldehyde dehydrogenase [Sphingobium sp. AEW010]TWD18409.1 acyl-CoA reductase-like NAD-dependent aldehyde dehydrogenase [Sphingobium sp. AEW013]TWD21037.1 acyl-CoA reductase-like NAD-dependent aldehyde dehydrogenase
MKQYDLVIDGQQVRTNDRIVINDPATGEPVGASPVATKADVDAAVRAARKAFASWSATSDEERQAAVRSMADALSAHSAELAELLTREQGKPLNGLGSRFELGGAEAWARYTAELTLPVEILSEDETGRVELHRKPLGVVASITPWNYPLMIAIWHIVPAIRSGNTVVLKPSPFTPLSTIRMVEILNEVLPAGVLNVVAGHDDLGPMLTEHPDVQKIVFTGSCSTGKKVMQSASDTLKRVTLELGGNDAGIVLDDADPKQIAEGLFWGAFINNGQTCAALKRLYVPDNLYEQVCSALVEYGSKVPMGNGLAEENVLGPLQNKVQFDKVNDLVEDAKAQGARVLLGGEPMGGNGHFYPVTLLADVTDGMRIVDEEQFGPVLPIIRYHNLEDAIALANASENGLGGSAWSSDPERAKQVAGRLEAGSVWINNHGAIKPHAPFGGIKSSGIGVEFGKEGLAEYTSIQVIHA